AARQLRLVGRECRLLGMVPLFIHIDALVASGDIPDRIDLIESELEGVVLATSGRLVARRWKRPATQIEVPVLRTSQREILWRRALPEASETDGHMLATMYPLAPALIDAAGRAARAASAAGVMRPEHVEAGIRTVLDDRLAGLATRITITQSWQDLVLPDDQTTA